MEFMKAVAKNTKSLNMLMSHVAATYKLMCDLSKIIKDLKFDGLK